MKCILNYSQLHKALCTPAWEMLHCLFFLFHAIFSNSQRSLTQYLQADLGECEKDMYLACERRPQADRYMIDKHTYPGLSNHLLPTPRSLLCCDPEMTEDHLIKNQQSMFPSAMYTFTTAETGSHLSPTCNPQMQKEDTAGWRRCIIMLIIPCLCSLDESFASDIDLHIPV